MTFIINFYNNIKCEKISKQYLEYKNYKIDVFQDYSGNITNDIQHIYQLNFNGQQWLNNIKHYDNFIEIDEENALVYYRNKYTTCVSYETDNILNQYLLKKNIINQNDLRDLVNLAELQKYINIYKNYDIITIEKK